MASFEQVIPIILAREGGYANVASDKGGETYRGLSRKYNPSWSGWAIIDKTPHPIARNTIFPELEQKVKDQYKSAYWNSYFNNIQSLDVAKAMFDSRINQSGGYGSLVKRALGSSMPFTQGVAVTSSDVAAINAKPADFYTKFMAQREAYYRHLNQPVNLQGWLNRLAEFPRSIAGAIYDTTKQYKGLLFGVILAFAVATFLAFLLTRQGRQITGIRLA